jgi:hypothetical protein
MLEPSRRTLRGTATASGSRGWEKHAATCFDWHDGSATFGSPEAAQMGEVAGVSEIDESMEP